MQIYDVNKKRNKCWDVARCLKNNTGCSLVLQNVHKIFKLAVFFTLIFLFLNVCTSVVMFFIILMLMILYKFCANCVKSNTSTE